MNLLPSRITPCPLALGTSSLPHTASGLCLQSVELSPGKEEKQSGCCLLHSCCLCGPRPSHAWKDGVSGKTLPVRLQGGGTPRCCRRNTHPVSGIRPHFLHTPQPNFLWISDHLLFPIMLLFTLSIWRIQMLNEKRERRKGGGEEFHFA